MASVVGVLPGVGFDFPEEYKMASSAGLLHALLYPVDQCAVLEMSRRGGDGKCYRVQRIVAVRAYFIAEGGVGRFASYPGQSFPNGREFPRVVALVGSAMKVREVDVELNTSVGRRDYFVRGLINDNVAPSRTGWRRSSSLLY